MTQHRISVPTEPFHPGSVVVDKGGWAWQKHKDGRWYSVRLAHGVIKAPLSMYEPLEWAILLLRHGPVQTYAAESEAPMATPTCDRLVRPAVDKGQPQPDGFRCVLKRDHVGDCERKDAKQDGARPARAEVSA